MAVTCPEPGCRRRARRRRELIRPFRRIPRTARRVASARQPSRQHRVVTSREMRRPGRDSESRAWQAVRPGRPLRGCWARRPRPEEYPAVRRAALQHIPAMHVAGALPTTPPGAAFILNRDRTERPRLLLVTQAALPGPDFLLYRRPPQPCTVGVSRPGSRRRPRRRARRHRLRRHPYRLEGGPPLKTRHRLP